MSELLNVFNLTVQQAHKMATEHSVADTPIVIGDVTVIPISKISCGFSYGGSNTVKGKTTAGAGAKISKTPLSFVAVIDGNLQILQVNEEETKKKGIVGALTPVINTVKEKFASKKAEKEAAKEADKAE